MKEYQIEEIKKTLIEVLRKHGVKKKAALFGSEKDYSTVNSPLLINVRREGVPA